MSNAVYFYRGKRKKQRPNSSLKIDKVARYYYHITSNDDFRKEWGDETTLSPIEGNKGNRCWDEPSNPRICVAPSIAHCISALPYCGKYQYFVYRTKDKEFACYPYGVEDSLVTKEKWTIKPTKFIFYGNFDPGYYIYEKGVDEDNCGAGAYDDMPRQRKVLEQWKIALANEDNMEKHQYFQSLTISDLFLLLECKIQCKHYCPSECHCFDQWEFHSYSEEEIKDLIVKKAKDEQI